MLQDYNHICFVDIQPSYNQFYLAAQVSQLTKAECLRSLTQLSPSLYTQSDKSMPIFTRVLKNRKGNCLPPQTKASRNAHDS